jgi:hypothetical protein
MSDHKKENQPKPLIYMVDPEMTEQVFSNRQRGESQEQREQDVQESTTNKEEKIEQIKREFGVYEVMAEIEKEKAIANEWTQAFRKPEQVEQPIVLEQQDPPKEKVVAKKKKKRKTVKEMITHLVSSTEQPKPICEAILFGEKTQFQVLGIREETVKIRIGHRVRIIKVSDINQLKVIPG